MNQNWNHMLEDNDDKEEYIEVKEPHHIQAILRAEQDQKNKAHEESILKIIDQKPTDPEPTTKQNNQKPKFIQDDRERVYPNQKSTTQKTQEKPTLQPQNTEKTNTDSQHLKKDEKPQRKQYRNKEQVNSKHNQPNKGKNNTNTHVYKEKKTRSLQKPKEQNEERLQQPRKKKYVQKNAKKMQRKQIQIIKGEEVTLQFQQQHYDNQIYVGKREVTIYLERAKQLLKQYDFIVLKSCAIYVSKVFLVAGLLAKEIPQLKQINIPSTIELTAITKQRSKLQTRAAIRVELSLGNLKKDHIGYQESPKTNLPQKQTKKEYQEKKETNKYIEKKPKYAEKQSYKTSYRERREGSSSPDERRLR